MTVGELIAMLRVYNPESPVAVRIPMHELVASLETVGIDVSPGPRGCGFVVLSARECPATMDKPA